MGFTPTPRRSRGYLTDLDFADDIALLSDKIQQAQELVFRVERSFKKVGLGLNAKKTWCLAYNIEDSESLHTEAGVALERFQTSRITGG